MNNKYMRIGEAAALLNVNSVTLRKYVNEGRVECSLNPGNQRVFTIEQLAVLRPELLENTAVKNGIVHYARASDGSDVLIDKQFKLLSNEYGDPDYKIKDKASGLNESRAGICRIIKLAKKGKLSTVYVTEKDRLTRFGYSYLEELLNGYDVKVIVLRQTETKSPHEELIQDFLSLLASFSGKYYHLRGHAQSKRFLSKTEEELTK